MEACCEDMSQPDVHQGEALIDIIRREGVETLLEEAAVIRKLLREEIVKKVHQAQRLPLAENSCGTLRQPVMLTYAVGPLVLDEVRVRAEALDCELRPGRTSDTHTDIGLEVTDVSVALQPARFAYATYFWEGEGDLLVTASGLDVWASAAMSVSPQPEARVDSVDVRLRHFELQVRACGSWLFGAIFERFLRDTVRQQVQLAIRDALRERLAGWLPEQLLQAAHALQAAKPVRTPRQLRQEVCGGGSENLPGDDAPSPSYFDIGASSDADVDREKEEGVDAGYDGKTHAEARPTSSTAAPGSRRPSVRCAKFTIPAEAGGTRLADRAAARRARREAEIDETITASMGP